jgi:hypothetical protein
MTGWLFDVLRNKISDEYEGLENDERIRISMKLLRRVLRNILWFESR